MTDSNSKQSEINMSRPDNPHTSRLEHDLHFTENEIRFKCLHFLTLTNKEVIKFEKASYSN